MKKLLTVLLVCFGLATYGQTTINPDTVCANATGEQYFVTNTPTSTYNWTSTNGVVTGNPAKFNYRGLLGSCFWSLPKSITSY
jgi:hypothetical protein